MKIFGFEISRAARASKASPNELKGTEIKAYSYSDEGSVFSNTGRIPIRSFAFNGEKTPGALGNPVNLVPDFQALRIRSYEALLNNDTIKTVTSPFLKWVVGSGLKLEAQPNEALLGFEGIKEDFAAFRTNVEAYWQIYADSKRSDYSGMVSLHENSANAFETVFVGGDVLTVLRVDANLNLTVQVIDGQHVKTPVFNGAMMAAAAKAGNTIFHGVEVDPTGKHVAFYVVKNKPMSFIAEYERIEAYGAESGCLMAWMEYGLKHRIDHKRAIPEMTATFEKVKKLDRYTEATVSSAEERAKVPWTIEHDHNSDGENPFEADIRRKLNGTNQTVIESGYELGKLTAKNISASEEKTVVNMPIGAKLKALDSDSEINYEPLWKAIFIQSAASAGIPPEVALRQYNSNYVASRAAIMAWSHEVNLRRKKHASYFYQHVYNLWLYMHVVKNKVDAEGYLKAVNSGNLDIIESYSVARWVGANMPHVDPKKEADAVRIQLGDPAIGETPLMSRQQAAEQLGLGEWEENFKEYQKEEKLIPTPPVPAPQPPAGETITPEKVTV
jgi:capsid protein